MLNDTEVPSAPLDWAARIHGELVLLDRVHADSWEPMEPDSEQTVVVEGALGTVERGAGTSLVIKTPPGEPAAASLVGLDGGGVLVVTHLGGEGGPDLRVAAQDVPDEAYQDTGVTFTAGFVGLVLFDGSSTWEMAGEQMLYVFVETPKGDYAVEVSDERTTDDDKRFRVVRLRKRA